MPKMKTSKTAAKRFKKTGSGRIRHQESMRVTHLYQKRRTTRLRTDADVHPTDLPKIKRLLGER
jgi:large subunit ribosomal protein L35